MDNETDIHDRESFNIRKQRSEKKKKKNNT